MIENFVFSTFQFSSGDRW